MAIHSQYVDANGVYRNKLGLTSIAQLDSAEYSMARARAHEIQHRMVDLGVQGYGLARQQAIHKHLFQDVYDWAGELRTIPLATRMDNGMWCVFAAPDAIVPSWQELEAKTSAFAGDSGLSEEQKHEALADIFALANHLHPFPEGNGRSLQIFMQQLALEQGVVLDYSKVDPKAWNRASALCGVYGDREIRDGENHLIRHDPDPRPIRAIFAEMAGNTKVLSQDQEAKSLAERVKGMARGFQVKLSALQGQRPLQPDRQTWSAEQEHRAQALTRTKETAAGALLTFAEIGCTAIQAAGGAAKVDWRAVEDAAALKSIRDDRQRPQDVFQAIAEASPATLTQQQRQALLARIDGTARAVGQQHRPSPGSDNEIGPR